MSPVPSPFISFRFNDPESNTSMFYSILRSEDPPLDPPRIVKFQTPGLVFGGFGGPQISHPTGGFRQSFVTWNLITLWQACTSRNLPSWCSASPPKVSTTKQLGSASGSTNFLADRVHILDGYGKASKIALCKSLLASWLWKSWLKRLSLSSNKAPCSSWLNFSCSRWRHWPDSV